MERNRIRLAVWAVSATMVAACVGWAIAAQNVVPDVCTYPTPPPNAQIVHCP